MKTIDERATKYADDCAPCYSRCGRWESCKNKCRDWFVSYNEYSNPATEQRQIDIEFIKDCLTEMQGEYITLEIINELVKEMKDE